jgi:dihydrofolate synthase/folylpolyglutamate synthase
MDYSDALKLIAQPILASDLPHTLDHMARLLDALDNPERAYPCVVVAGSVGKGTTCHQIAVLMDEHLKVGFYTSPHLHIFRERFAVNGRLMTQADFIANVELVQQAAEKLDTRYSTFELATALALSWFRQQAVDIAVLEIGIGGRYDAVNVVSNRLAVITPIEREHAAMLGGTLTSIAQHKAGIIKPNGEAIAAPQVPEVETVLRDEAKSQQANITFEPVDRLAVAACAHLMQHGIIPPFPLPSKSPMVHLAGRMEQIERGGKTLLIDGAHTPGSARRLRAAIEQIAPTSHVSLIIGMLRDKSVQAFLAAFDSPQFHITLTQSSSHRALSADEIQHTADLQHATITIQPNLQSAIDQALENADSLIVITGSLRIAAIAREMLSLLDEKELEEARLTRAIFEGNDYLTKLR